MSTLFGLLSFVAFVGLFIGLFKPNLVVRWGEKRTRGKVFLYYGISFLIFAMIGSATAPETLSLKITSPKNNSVVTKESISIKGSVTMKADVFVNNEKFSLDASNNFSNQMPLKMGDNQIVIQAKAGDQETNFALKITRTTEEDLARVKAEKEAEAKKLEAEKKEKERLARMIGQPDQYLFHVKLKDFASRYKSAPNEMKKSKVSREMRAFCKSHLGNLSFKGWKGVIKYIGTTEGGDKAYITIRAAHAGKRVAYQTWNNQLSDMMTNSMLSLNSKVYKQVEELSIGDNVIFSGCFYRDNDREVNEQSMTEEGWVTDPEFTIKFKDVKKSD